MSEADQPEKEGRGSRGDEGVAPGGGIDFSPGPGEGVLGTLPCEEGEEEVPPPTLPQPGQTILGRYTVLRQLGQGAMGVVLSAYDARLDRRVALKLLRAWSGERARIDEEQGRFLREAQAMARLSHPNVVGVYDAGRLEDGTLFIAMEHVEGQTLRQWQQGRGWKEVLGQYRAAGRGLAAAHEAGLIHHDFKPDNVLVGADGRARVTDFGLARLSPGPVASGSLEPGLPALPTASGAVAPLTMRGDRWMGTPAYMAEEQFQGQRGDARSDLYAFCVALYEGLYGKVPYEAATVAELREAQRAGKVRPPEGVPVPAWVARTVLRGLQREPVRRPSSMGEVLKALAEDPEVKSKERMRKGAVTSAMVVLGVLAVWGWSDRQQRCEELGQRLAGVWDETVKQRVRQALVATGLPYAPETAERVVKGLEAYAGGWVKQRTEVCLGVSREGETRAESLWLREEMCLERRRSQLRALTELLSQAPDAELVSKAVQAVQALPPLEYCADAKALTAAVPPPEEPTVRAKVEALQEQVDRLEVLLAAGKFKLGVARADELVAQVEPVGYAPLLARTLFLSAQLRSEAGDYKGAEERLQQAMTAAARGKDTATLARAWSARVSVVGYRMGRLQEALSLRPMVEQLVELADDDRIRASALTSLGMVLLELGRYEEALQECEAALALREKVLGPEHPEVASSLSDLGNVFQKQGQYEKVRQMDARVLAIREKVLGPEHPSVAAALNNVGADFWEMGQYEEARAAFARGLALRERVLGPEHPSVAASLNNLGLVLGDLGRYEEARVASARALAIREKALGAEHPDAAASLNNVGLALLNLGRYEEARATLVRGLAIREKLLGPQHPDVVSSLNNLGLTLKELGRYEEARAIVARGLAIREKVLGPEHPSVASSLDTLGLALKELGRYEEARQLHTRALMLREKRLGAEHPRVATLLANLGSLLETLGKYEEARQLGERSLAVRLKALGPEHPDAAVSLSSVGDALRGLGHLAEAREKYTRALELQEKLLPAGHPERLGPLLGMGLLSLAEGSPAEARPWLERALAVASVARRARVQFPLAQALWEGGGEKPRAVELAAQAQEFWSRHGRASDAKHVSRWLEAHAL
ncbi:tetratricopeptide repeat protein [Hyalangium sp.]|uniref:tetratricopeptide repeat protein n=1 Tax=Hyalangium sp. TaxID=2028555 RepID=UPI002D269903|nr:tetratricopeptide repeat protein [Hyalangium sp.]HYH94860.1 tetratricopeptide repeat protein [Hyalangium sp.]